MPRAISASSRKRELLSGPPARFSHARSAGRAFQAVTRGDPKIFYGRFLLVLLAFLFLKHFDS